MTTISAPQLSISVPCLNPKCHNLVTVKASLTRAVSRSGIFCPDCLPSKQKPAPAVWTKELYQDYLQSAHWIQFKAMYAMNHKRKCMVCGVDGRAVQIDLHHNTYERIGGEYEDDVVYLCHDCHELFHYEV